MPADKVYKSRHTVFAAVGLAIFLTCVMSVYTFFWHERGGTIKTDDCRSRIPVNEGSVDTWFKNFTCSYRFTKSGRLMYGLCESVIVKDSGACETVYYYEKKPTTCTDPKLPYLGEDDHCYSVPP